MIQLVSATPMKFELNGKEHDFDAYTLSSTSPFSSKDINLCIDFIDNTISGDCVAYGDWFDMIDDDCKMYFNFLKEENKLLREPNLNVFSFSS